MSYILDRWPLAERFEPPHKFCLCRACCATVRYEQAEDARQYDLFFDAIGKHEPEFAALAEPL